MEYIKINPDKPEKHIIAKAKAALKNGGVIALPTETVYGLVGDLFSQKAIEKIYKVKGRDFSKQLPIFLPDTGSMFLYAENIQPWAYKLMDAFWPGPLTLVLSKKKELNIPLKTDTLGFRIPDHPVPLTILKEYGPLVSTSANISGGKEALNAEEVKKYFGGNIDLVLDGGQTILQTPSTVVDCAGNSPKIVREGKITGEEIEKIIEK